MTLLVDEIATLRRAALIRVAEEYGMHYSIADIHEALADDRRLKQGLRRLLAKQPADTRIGYAVRRFSSAILHRLFKNERSDRMAQIGNPSDD